MHTHTLKSSFWSWANIREDSTSRMQRKSAPCAATPSHQKRKDSRAPPSSVGQQKIKNPSPGQLDPDLSPYPFLGAGGLWRKKDHCIPSVPGLTSNQNLNAPPPDGATPHTSNMEVARTDGHRHPKKRSHAVIGNTQLRQLPLRFGRQILPHASVSGPHRRGPPNNWCNKCRRSTH